MSQDAPTTAARSNRRASRRLAPASQLRIECRKGASGLGRNIAVRVLDLSETGLRLLVNISVADVKEVEVILPGTSYLPSVKRVAHIVRVAAADENHFAVGLHFSPPLDYPTYLALCNAFKVLR